MTLEDVAIGKKAIITELKNSGSIRRRLLDLGIMPYTTIEPILSSPSGHMRSYFVKGTMIALRDDETKDIMVEERG